MSDAPIPNVGTSDAEILDQTIQPEWDRFAMPDLSFDPESHRSSLNLTNGSTELAADNPRF